MSKKLLVSLLSGLAILLITWAYQNYDFSFSAEDAFFKKLSLWKYKVLTAKPDRKVDMVFVNTGKDIAIVDDSLDYGSVAVSDRKKIFELIRFINLTGQQPLYTALDIQFYYRYTADPEADSLLGAELNKMDRVLIPVVKNAEGQYKRPLFKTVYAYSDYQTFGAGFNKFRILNHGSMPSVPVMLEQQINRSVYRDHTFYATCNDSLCFSAIWPTFYLKNETVKSNKDISYARYYNIGEVLFGMAADSVGFSQFFTNKLIIIGNFEEDVHVTPVGKMSGPVLLANIYLSLINREHIVSFWLLFVLLIVFTALSYIAWFSKMPQLKLNIKFIFSSYLIKFVRGYVSYFGCMFALSLLAVFLFNIQIALFLPSFIFAGIEYIRQKKYRIDK